MEAINELKKLSEGEGGDEPTDDWQPPADWLTVPEPGEMEICLLICTASTKGFGVGLADFETGNSGGKDLQCGIKIDWGDGTSDDRTVVNQYGYYYNYFGHSYTESKQYIVKVTGNVNTNAWLWNHDTTQIIQIAKIGSGIHLWTKTQPASSNIWGSQIYLKWIKVLNSGGLYDESYGGVISSQAIFSGCNSLQKIEIPSRLKKINVDSIFSRCYGLTSFDFSDVLEITANYAFSNAGCVYTGIGIPAIKKLHAFGRYDSFKPIKIRVGKIFYLVGAYILQFPYPLRDK